MFEFSFFGITKGYCVSELLQHKWGIYTRTPKVRKIDEHSSKIQWKFRGDCWHEGLKQIPTWRQASGSTSSLAYDIRRYISIMNISWSLTISLKWPMQWFCLRGGSAMRLALYPDRCHWWCVVHGSQVNLVHLVRVCTTCIGLVSGIPCRGCCVCRGSFNLWTVVLCMYLNTVALL